MIMNNFSKNKKEKGFVILFAILISAVMLLISVGIFNIVQKQSILSSFSRESQKAFYAADSALECALRNDLNSPTVITKFPFTLADTTIDCSEDSSISVYKLSALSDSESVAYGFSYQASDDAVGCAFVLVEKEKDDTVSPIEYNTRVTAIGFNSCTSGGLPNYDDPNILERRLSATYTAI